MQHRRRILLCLPDHPTEELRQVAWTIAAVLAPLFQVREFPDDALTPIDNPLDDNPIILRLSEDDRVH